MKQFKTTYWNHLDIGKTKETLRRHIVTPHLEDHIAGRIIQFFAFYKNRSRGFALPLQLLRIGIKGMHQIRDIHLGIS